MSYRKIHFTPSNLYHIFNRGIARQPMFVQKRDYQRAMELIDYYRFRNPPLRFSHYHRLPLSFRQEILKELHTSGTPLISIHAFCLMPNHFHFLLQETIEGGIQTFAGNFQNSFAKYFNTKNERPGSVFQASFKGVLIETEEQLVHVARYIHLNPLTSLLIKNEDELERYPWSSYPDYLGKRQQPFVVTTMVLSHFRSRPDFQRFTIDQAEYQQELEKIRHLLLE